ncbi:MAG: hypothetical protein HQK63_07915 [Desulfamplus sp.]|nr:hypothetical protein [Desulfamplus sp.]
MDLTSFSQQLAGRKFGELVMHHYKKQDYQTILLALEGTIQELPENARPCVESWIDEIVLYGKNPNFWQRDCGEVFTEICDLARRKLANYMVTATEDHLFSMFQIIVISFAYGAHKHPQSKAFIQQSIGVGFLRRLFS